jgi:hypothetical protein
MSKIEYPYFRMSILEINKDQLAQDIAMHNENMGALLRDGNYEIKAVSIQDSATVLNVVMVMQRRSESA